VNPSRDYPSQSAPDPARLRPERLSEFLGSSDNELCGDLPTAADLHLVTDARYRVVGVAAEPAALQALYEELLDLVIHSDRQTLRTAAERCIAEGTNQAAMLHLRSAPTEALIARLAPVQHIEGAGLVLTANRLESGTTNDVERLRGVLDLMDVAVFWKDRQSRFLGANAKSLEALGVERESDVIGKTDHDFLPAEQAEGFHADDREVMGTGIPILDRVETLTTPDGLVETLLTSKMPFRNGKGEVAGLVGYFAVVTKAVQTEQALHAMQERYALALDTTRDGIFEYDLATGEVEISARFAELFALNPVSQRLPADDLLKGMDRSARKALRADFKPMAEDPTRWMTGEIPIELADGSFRWFKVIGAPFCDGDETNKIIGSITDVTEKKQREEDLVHRATHDDLTGLANRAALREEIERSMASRQRMSLLYLDLDHFKLINDSLGHNVGDQLLEAIAERLSDLLLDEEQTVLARLGGDEFSILIRDQEPQEAEALANRVLTSLEVPVTLADTDIYTSCSIGIVHLTSEHQESLELLRDGDIALYQAKADGKACSRVFEPEMRVDADFQLSQQNRIRQAVEQMDFCLAYQPIIAAGAGKITGLEALLRWDQPDSEPLSPASFLPYLEQSGLIISIGAWVVDEACRQLAEWRATLPAAESILMSINLSRVQFRSLDLVESIVDTVSAHSLVPADVIIEVTETAISSDFDQMATALKALRAAGFAVAIDDFGVGQSSLATLHELPVDILKLDMAFVSRIGDPAAEAMIVAVGQVAKALQLSTTAEGVETEEQKDFLVDCGYNRLQGYLLGCPTPPSEIAKLLGRSG